MTTLTIEPTDAIRLASSDDEVAWHTARGDRRVTASEARRIMSGGRLTWRNILNSKLNDSKHFSTKHTRRGHEREPFLLSWANDVITPVVPNSHLWANKERPQDGATPDGFGIDPEGLGAVIGVEVKSHDFGWDLATVPPGHLDQCQAGMAATGAKRWLYVWEVMGEDGQPTLDDPFFVWIDRDEVRIAQLRAEIDRFLEWWDAGAPAADDLPEELDETIAKWAGARAERLDAEKREKEGAAEIRDYVKTVPNGMVEGVKRAGTRGGFVFSVNHKTKLDEKAWEAAEPEGYAAFKELQARVADTIEAATALYSAPVTNTALRFAAVGEDK